MKVSPPQIDRTHVLQAGRRLVYFGGCDYFRLSRDPRVLRALREGLRKFGLNVAASRTTSGNHPLYGRLEKELADFFGVESATLAPNGWAPNLMAAQALAGQFSHVLLDERTHPSVADAALFVGCPIVKFRHHDPADLDRVLARLARCQPLVMTDGMFPRDGSVAPVRNYLKILPRGGLILLDDAHAAGVLGETGRGTAQQAGVSSQHIIQTITLSKAFGVFGGAVLGKRKLQEAIIARSRLFIGTTPVPLPLAAAALESLKILRTNGTLRVRLHRNARYVRLELRKRGIAAPDHPGPVIALFPRNDKDARRLSRRLLAAGICPPFSNYPGGPPGGCFRFAISSVHSRRQLQNLVAAVAGQ
jgi:7-keto-8-aminopelargonate synthetase-like enzyme